MADQKQLEILKQGVEAWNNWRAANPDAKVHLTGADLTKAYLAKADLDGAYLTEANLWAAGLRGANLAGAILVNAKLAHADLRGANLSEADLMVADLSGANFTESLIGGTTFGSNDLSDSIGLERVKHAFSSSMGMNTILNSKGKLPIEFLRVVV